MNDGMAGGNRQPRQILIFYYKYWYLTSRPFVSSRRDKTKCHQISICRMAEQKSATGRRKKKRFYIINIGVRACVPLFRVKGTKAPHYEFCKQMCLFDGPESCGHRHLDTERCMEWNSIIQPQLQSGRTPTLYKLLWEIISPTLWPGNDALIDQEQWWNEQARLRNKMRA